MKQLKIAFILLFGLIVGTLAWGGGGRSAPGGGYEGGNQMVGGYQQSRSARGFQGNQGYGGGQGYDGMGGRNGGQQYGGGSDRRYRSNLYSDDDVYGYDATYPNGEAAYINYRSKDARARRGPEFARTSRAYSRQGGRGNGGSGFNQMQEYGGGMW